jgi:ATP-dependent Clp protease ATP-binding subunit ClpC
MAKEIREIVDLMLTRVGEALGEREIELEVTDAARELLAQEGYDPVFGARPLRRTIQKLLENPISSAILRGEFAEGDTILVDAEDGQIKLRLKVADAAAGE